jgi:hypothetical protein
MACKRGASDNQNSFDGEVVTHFRGLKGLDKPIAVGSKACGLLGLWVHEVHRS